MNFLPLLQETTPNTVDNLILGLVFVIGLPLLYLLSAYVRRRNALRDLELIETLAAEEQKRQGAGKPPSAERPQAPAR